MSTVGDKSVSDEVSSLKAELAECRRYAESLHAAIYGGIEVLSQLQLGEHLYTDATSEAGSSEQGRTSRQQNGQPAKKTALQDWLQRMETAPESELVRIFKHR